MLFEFSFVKKYLTPKKKQLSVSLIGLMSMAVISLVVWLVVVFLSVTEGIEKNWLHKLTAVNAPIQLKPTEHYFHSYYYNIDRHSSASHYLAKSIGQKTRALLSDPYDPKVDAQLPKNLAQSDRDSKGNLKDPVKGLFAILADLKASHPKLAYQDVELGGAMLRLNLLRPDPYSFDTNETESQLTHVSYLTSFADQNPWMDELLVSPTISDLNHLLYLIGREEAGRGEKLNALLEDVTITKLKTLNDLIRLPFHLLPEKEKICVTAYNYEGEISHLIFSSKETECKMERRGEHLFFKAPNEPEIPLSQECPLFFQGELEFEAALKKDSLSSCKNLKDLIFTVSGRAQNHLLQGEIHFEGLQVAEALLPPRGLCLFKNPEESEIILAKNFQKNGIKLGDRGFLSYPAPTITGTQEMRIPVVISGFYDPGVMAVGIKSILVPKKITEAVNASNSAFSLDKTEANKVLVWLPNLKESKNIKASLLAALKDKGIEKYWRVETFHEYEFAKDLMQQFQSDKYLFTLVGIIILIVACTNIISLLVLLVSDKKQEIGILQAMGAKKRSITAIFALSGTSLGLFSCLLGLLLAFLTLKNIDSVVAVLSTLQGHEAFNAQFFGHSLPKQISSKALWFAAFATPLISLVAGVIPAIKASRLNPCDMLRS